MTTSVEHELAQAIVDRIDNQAGALDGPLDPALFPEAASPPTFNVGRYHSILGFSPPDFTVVTVLVTPWDMRQELLDGSAWKVEYQIGVSVFRLFDLVPTTQVDPLQTNAQLDALSLFTENLRNFVRKQEFDAEALNLTCTEVNKSKDWPYVDEQLFRQDVCYMSPHIFTFTRGEEA